MNTARTVQVLDANNNNISPATCIDSLYFEMIDNQTTYRMAVRDKFVLAGNLTSATEYREQNLSGNIDTLALPFVSAQAVPGTDQKMHRLDMGSIVVGDKIKSAVERYIQNTYLKIEDASAGYFIKADGDNESNLITNAVGMTDGTNKILTVGKTGTKTGLVWKDANSYVDVSDSKMTVHTDGSINIDTKSLLLGTSEATSVNIGNSNADIALAGNAGTVSTTGNLSIKSDIQLQLTGGDSVITAQSGSIVLTSGNVQIGNGTNADITVKGKSVPSWPTGTKKYLVYEDGGMSWQEVDKTTIVVDDSGSETPGQNETIIKFRKVQFQGGDQNGQSLIKPNTGTDPGNLVFKDIQFIKEGGTDSKQIGYDIGAVGTTDIKLKSICGVSLLASGTDTNINAVLDNNPVWENLKRGVTYNSTTTGKVCGQVSFAEGSGWSQIQSGVEFTGNSLSADAYYINSDERLKENISQIDSDRELPEFVSFYFKDAPEKIHYGVIAQDVVEKGYSELVNEKEDGYLAVDYTQLLCLAVDRLKKENNSLKERISRLEQAISVKES